MPWHWKKKDGVLVAPGFGERGGRKKFLPSRLPAQEFPFFGICLGMQMAIVEFARMLWDCRSKFRRVQT
ncbi:MAG: hypothetical protein Ct9H300mP28_28460 [Pseudomonadota bacterium]|nr:MAG: hypothetical protein Ct9H300mP28_28460 [Pseudomonadota bacterium]